MYEVTVRSWEHVSTHDGDEYYNWVCHRYTHNTLEEIDETHNPESIVMIVDLD